MAAKNVPIYIEQGADFTFPMAIVDQTGSAIDVSGWTFRGQVRLLTSSAAALLTFAFTTTSASVGFISATITDTDSAALTLAAPPNYQKLITRAVYDIEGVKGDGTVVRLFEGVASISPEATK